MNQLLDRETIYNEIKTFLLNFDSRCKDVTFKKGIYIYGSSGCGKTKFILDLLNDMDYDIIKYDAGDVRNKALIDTITSNNVSTRNVLQLMNKKEKKIAIVMDEIDGMNNGDKGGITSLIKLIRQKKTKKQKLEHVTLNPIICIGNYYVDKKIKELMNVCNIFELKKPTDSQILNIIKNKNQELFKLFTQPFTSFRISNASVVDFVNNHKSASPSSLKSYFSGCESSDHNEVGDSNEKMCNMVTSTSQSTDSTSQSPQVNQAHILQYIQGDMRKLNFIQDLYIKKPQLLNNDTFHNIFQLKSYNEDSKKITKYLINAQIPLNEHNLFMNETDRTIVALLYHENIVDPISKFSPTRTFPFYLKILQNMCYADYIDRITFQQQIWTFNEMSSLIKTFYNNKIYHDTFPENCNKYNPTEVRFTKVLTKYSTEYNNQLFIYNLCQELDMDKKDLIAFFQEIQISKGTEFYNNIEKMAQTEKIFENYNISKLDIKRVYRYLDKNVKKDAIIQDIDELDDCEL